MRGLNSTKGIIIVSILIGILFISNGVYAYATDKQSDQDSFMVSNTPVNISVTQMMDSGGTDVTYVAPSEISPGDVISKKPIVTNNGITCYIRVKVIFTNPSTVIASESGKTPIGTSSINVNTSNWTLKTESGTYYYYLNNNKKTITI